MSKTITPLSNRLHNPLRITMLVAVIISLFNAGYAQTPEPLNGIDAYIEKSLRDWNIPGLAIAIVKDDSVVLAKGYGVREIHKKEAVDANTIFVIASNTKAFTATALGLLVQEGKIAWDDPVLQYLPEFQLFDPLACSVTAPACPPGAATSPGINPATTGRKYCAASASRSRYLISAPATAIPT
jgi:CubicO group peptidase (beta-lactamase class C family)